MSPRHFFDRAGINVLCMMLIMCAVVVPVLTIYVMGTSHWHGPFRDMWEIYPFLQKIIAHSWTFGDLWESYGYSHRLFIPRLLFIADHRWFDASNHLLISVSVLCQGLTCAVFARVLWRESGLSLAERTCLLCMVIALQSSGTLLFNFMHTFDVQWFVCCTCVVMACYFLSRLPQREKTLQVGGHCNQTTRKDLLCAGCFVVLACLNNFSGMVAWPIWFVFCWKFSRGPAIKLILMALSAAFIFCYLQGVHGAGIDYPATRSAWKMIAYLLVVFPSIYLVSPLADRDFLPFGNAALVLIVPVFLVLGGFWRRFLFGKPDRHHSFLKLFLACIGLFGVGVALVTAIGRGYDPANAHASRYQNIIMLFWSAMIPLFWLEARERDNAVFRVALRALCGMVFAAFMCCQWTSWNQNMHLGSQVNRAHLALMLGFSHEVPMIAPTVSRSMIYVPGYNLERERRLYEQARQGIFHGALAEAWRDGVWLSQIPRVCSDVEWKTSLYRGPYARYMAFSVSGQTHDVEAALLTDAAGKVIAAAIPGDAESLGASLAYFWGVKNPVLRGFVATDEPPYALVMLSGGSGQPACKQLVNSPPAP
jgi:hypothetical protein